ncbi:MAG: hypothetical protein E7606_03275 [Ruminococcaceae bacterium]|nr:hypothetical protein [Oscillospiraceae bacterium]
MKMVKILVCFFLMLSLIGCSAAKALPRDVLSEAIAGCSLPSGTVYAIGEGAGGISTPSELPSVIVGGEAVLEGVKSGVFYLSAREEICEAAVLFCYTASEAREAAELCQARGALLMHYAEGVSSCVSVKGKYVLFAAGKDASRILAALERAVKG